MPRPPTYNNCTAFGPVTGIEPTDAGFAFTINASRPGTETRCRLTCVIEGNRAQSASEHIRPGSHVQVNGYLRDDDDGAALVVLQWQFVGPKPE